MSESEWSNVKAKSNARDDSIEPCVICKEDFGLQEQVSQTLGMMFVFCVCAKYRPTLLLFFVPELRSKHTEGYLILFWNANSQLCFRFFFFLNYIGQDKHIIL